MLRLKPTERQMKKAATYRHRPILGGRDCCTTHHTLRFQERDLLRIVNRMIRTKILSDLKTYTRIQNSSNSSRSPLATQRENKNTDTYIRSRSQRHTVTRPAAAKREESERTQPKPFCGTRPEQVRNVDAASEC